MMTQNSKLSQPLGGDYVIAVDIGTAEIRVCCAILYSEDEIKIAGFGHCTSTGFSEDGITSMDRLKENISTAYSTADTSVRRIYDKSTLAKIDNPKVFVSVSGKFMTYRNNDGSCSLDQKNVTDLHIEKAFSNATSFSVKGYDLIFANNNYYAVDSNMYIDDPKGQTGGQLKSYAHLIYADKDFLTNIRHVISCCIPTNYNVEFLFSGFASAYAVVNENEKNLGVCVLDIGHGSVDISIFNRGYIIFSGSSPIAGHVVTRDIAVLNGLTEKCAENIKIKCGCADPENVNDNHLIKINSAGAIHQEINIYPKTLAEMIETKYSHLLLNAIHSIKGVDSDCTLGAGFVLTGAGSKMKGIKNCFSKVLIKNKLPELANKVRIGEVSDKLTGLSDEIDPIKDAAIIGMLKLSRMIDAKESDRHGNSVFRKAYLWVNNLFGQ